MYPIYISQKIRFTIALAFGLCLSLFAAAQTTLYNESFGTDTLFPTGWTVTSGKSISINNAVTSTGYTGSSAGSNMLFKNSADTGLQQVVYDNNLSTIGYKIISVVWGGRRANTFSPAVKFEWSTDGVNWDSLPFTKVPATATWQIDNSFSRFLPPAATNQSNLRFRFSYTSTGTEASSSYRIDDFVVQGINDLYYESFGMDTIMPSGWVVTSGTDISINNTVNSNRYNGFSGGSNMLMTNSTGSGLQEVTYDNNLSTVGYVNITVLWGARRANTFSPPLAFEWSNDGATWNAVPFTEVTSSALWNADNDTVRLVLPVGAEGQANLRFRFSYTATGTESASSYRIDDFSVQGDVATGIHSEVHAMPACLVYSPAKNLLKINMEFQQPEAVDMALFNSLGQNVFTYQSSAPATTYDNLISLPQLSQGVYLVRIDTKEGVISRKVMLY